MRKLLLLAFAMLLVVGCNSSSSKVDDKPTINMEASRFFKVYLDDSDYSFYVDKETRVMYFVIHPTPSYVGYMSVFVDSVGKPILYEGEIPEGYLIILQVLGSLAPFLLNLFSISL